MRVHVEEAPRAAFLFRVDGRIAGSALLRKGPPHQVAEFLVLRKYRRRGVGCTTAREILTHWPGEWATHQVPGNHAAVAFWRHTIPVEFTETVDADGTTQRFRASGQESS